MIRAGSIVFLILIFWFGSAANAQPANYRFLDQGVEINPTEIVTGERMIVRVTFMSANVARVTVLPAKDQLQRESLSVIATPLQVQVDKKVEAGRAVLSSDRIKIFVDLKSGGVSFAGPDGRSMLVEGTNGGRIIEPAVFAGEPFLKVKQIFRINKGEAFYGLGQHQEDIWDYRNRQVIFFQNNTEVAVPFLVSSGNYGILWDNYSYGKAGDTRDFLPISHLKLFDKKGEEGWLTASFVNDRKKPGVETFEKAQSEISYSWLGDSRVKLPGNFTPAQGSVTWEGSLSSDIEGLHTLKVKYAGYCKIWLDGRLIFDRWREAWNPGSGIVEMNIGKNRKYAFKMEWIPNGSESYLDLGYLPPLPKEDENLFAFESEAARKIDYYFVYGKNLDEVISGYRFLTGKAVMPPRWAMGFWQSRERYKTQEELLNTVAEFRKRHIPLDNIVQDWSYWKEDQWGSQEFDPVRFPDPDKMIAEVHDKFKAQFMISVWPKFYEGIDTYKTFNEKGWLYKRNIADRQRDWIGKGYISTFYDAFSKDAREAFWKLIHDKLSLKGVDAWWMDASEPDILSNVSPQYRKLEITPTALGAAAEFLNAYPLQNAKGIYEGQRKSDPDRRVFLLTRSGFAGSQRYAATIWSGDIAARWEDMKAQISAGLNFSMSGLPYWTMDIGGFAVERRYERPEPKDLEEWRELQTRWFQFGAFAPLFRSHGQFPYREIYNIAPEGHPAYQSMLYYNKLRYRLMPYIYSLCGDIYYHDYTMMRGLVMDFPKDPRALSVSDQYMFGPSLLVSPVYSYKATFRNLYLPSGQGWYDLYDGRYHAGGQLIQADAPYQRMPVFVKEGSILAVGPELQYVAEKPADPITLCIYGGRDAHFSLYEDEGLNYNYEKGAFARILISYDNKSSTVTIEKRVGSFPRMLSERTFYLRLIDKNHPSGIDNGNPQKIVKYNGSRIVIQL